MYSCWKLTENSRIKLSKLFEQKNPDFIGHHITYMFGPKSELPPDAEIYVVGECSIPGIQALVVDVNGTIVRPDGSIYHITWSLDKSKGFKPVDSNKAIMEHGFDHLNNEIQIDTIPTIIKF